MLDERSYFEIVGRKKGSRSISLQEDDVSYPRFGKSSQTVVRDGNTTVTDVGRRTKKRKLQPNNEQDNLTFNFGSSSVFGTRTDNQLGLVSSNTVVRDGDDVFTQAVTPLRKEDLTHPSNLFRKKSSSKRKSHKNEWQRMNRVNAHIINLHRKQRPDLLQDVTNLAVPTVENDVHFPFENWVAKAVRVPLPGTSEIVTEGHIGFDSSFTEAFCVEPDRLPWTNTSASQMQSEQFEPHPNTQIKYPSPLYPEDQPPEMAYDGVWSIPRPNSPYFVHSAASRPTSQSPRKPKAISFYPGRNVSSSLQMCRKPFQVLADRQIHNPSPLYVDHQLPEMTLGGVRGQPKPQSQNIPSDSPVFSGLSTRIGTNDLDRALPMTWMFRPIRPGVRLEDDLSGIDKLPVHSPSPEFTYTRRLSEE